MNYLPVNLLQFIFIYVLFLSYRFFWRIKEIILILNLLFVFFKFIELFFPLSIIVNASVGIWIIITPFILMAIIIISTFVLFKSRIGIIRTSVFVEIPTFYVKTNHIIRVIELLSNFTENLPTYSILFQPIHNKLTCKAKPIGELL